ncbi:hypothetical protein [Lysinibacillus sp. G4S2]|uniref:hypothetical protein n=1 Tax=Lysinibacillus sp. G4S2 TaxID=3055859 RepID=UPI0025A2F379|nr:hypothetical protein [Lysinibacillus sp. G4S2]MDM5246433.1 hypothetical protein [Lysinibacillus sp. G4S2]
MLTKENHGIQSEREIFMNPIPSSGYGVILKTESDVINNTSQLVINEITMEASSLVDEKVITILPAIQTFMQCNFDDYDLMASDIVNGSLILTYGVVNFNFYDSLSDLISNELHTIHEPLTKVIEDNILIDVILTVQIETN